MNKGLSSREKILLIFLTVFMFVFLSAYFLIMPTTKEKEEAQVNYELAQMEQMQVVTQITSLISLRQTVQDTKQQVEENLDKLEEFDEIEFLEREFTTFCLQNGLTILSLQSIKDSDFNGGDLLVKYRIQLRAIGNLVDLLKVSDFINDKYSFRLLSVAMNDDNSQTVNGDYVIEAVLKID